jgi:hypothetical protein
MKSARGAIVLGVIFAAMSMPLRAEFIADQSRIRATTASISVLDLVECRIDKGADPAIW